jgi:inositol-pentakisphosphate 2-kinase
MVAQNAKLTGDMRENFCSALLPLLTGTPVLHTLSKLQRTLDSLDIEGLSKLWHEAEISSPIQSSKYSAFFESTTTEPKAEPEAQTDGHAQKPNGRTNSHPIGVSSVFLEAPEPEISDWVAFIDKYLSSNRPKPANGVPSVEDLRYYMLAYLLSATFKDCSIIVQMDILGGSPVPTKEEVKADTKMQERVRIIDLDPKGMVRLQKWEKLDSEIVHAYAGVGTKKVCIDDWSDDNN